MDIQFFPLETIELLPSQIASLDIEIGISKRESNLDIKE